MKKTMSSILLILCLCSVYLVKVSAYSPHFLPGGKNYISSDNIIKIGETVSTIDSFLVKPYVNYTFSLSQDYTDGRDFLMMIYLYDDDELLEEISLYNREHETLFNHSTELHSYYYSFTTSSKTNYISFEFQDNGNYVSGEELINVQLEEGDLPTTYESYIPGSIIDTSSPYFSGDGTIISYFDQPITLDEIKESLTAYDDIDGDLTSSIRVVEDNYTPNIETLGNHTIIFSVSDSSNNETQVTINIEIIDLLPPVFSNIPVIIAVYPNTYTLEDIQKMITASDNYDSNISESITLVKENYIENSLFVGNYEIEFMVSDSSGNIANYTQKITVTDEEGPIISGIDDISVGYNQILSLKEIQSSLKIIDNYDDSSSLYLKLESDDYSKNNSKLGSYTIKFSATDSSGNKTIKDVNVSVVDEIGPVVYLNNSTIQVYSDLILSLPDFAKLLVRTNELNENQEYCIYTRYDSYTKSANIPGTYHMYLDFEDNYGKSYSKNFQIKVIDKNYDSMYINKHIDIEKPISMKPVTIFLIGGSGIVLFSSIGFFTYKIIKKRRIV
ncbi:MAG: hypothetical protein WC152_05435 [Candidatus Izemoplasmatales bacterium]